MGKVYYRANEFKEDILNSRHFLFERGYKLGFHSGDEFISFKESATSYIYAHPFSGKTSFLFDILVNIARTYNIAIAIYSPEGGGKSAVVSSLVQVYLGKKLHGKNRQYPSDEEWMDAIEFVHKHFVIFDPDIVNKDGYKFTFKEIYNNVAKANKEYGVEIKMVVIDPFNYVAKDSDDSRKTIADYTLDSLMLVNKISEKMKLHTIIIMHLKDEDTIVDKDGFEYLPKPYPTKIANGQNVFRAGQQLIGIYRCPAGAIEKKTGVPYPENCTEILVQKNKIFGSGTTGSFRLFWDDDCQRFYEVISDNKYYIGEYDEYINPVSAVNANLKQSTEAKPIESWYDRESNPFF